MPCSAPVLDDFGRREGFFFSYYNKKLGTARKYCLLFSPTLAKYWNVYYISFPASTTQHYNTKWQLQRRSQRPKSAYKPSSKSFYYFFHRTVCWLLVWPWTNKDISAAPSLFADVKNILLLKSAAAAASARQMGNFWLTWPPTFCLFTDCVILIDSIMDVFHEGNAKML